MTDKPDQRDERKKRSEAGDVDKLPTDREGSPPPPKRKFRGNDRDQ